MINHVSVGARDPERVAGVFAELWGGCVFPFPSCPGAYIVLADDGRGTALEVTPLGIELLPGDDLPVKDENFTPSEDHGAKFTPRPVVSEYTATHVNISTHLTADEVKAIGKREGWRTLACSRGGGLFQLIEIWAENRLMIEVFTPDAAEQYRRVMNPQFIAKAMQALPAKPVAADLNLIG